LSGEEKTDKSNKERLTLSSGLGRNMEKAVFLFVHASVSADIGIAQELRVSWVNLFYPF